MEEKFICGHYPGGIPRWMVYQPRPCQFLNNATRLGTIKSEDLPPLADFTLKDALELVEKRLDEGADMHIILRGLCYCRLAFTDKNAEEVA